MRNIEIGIPILNSLFDAKDTVSRAILLPGVSSIHLSVNIPGSFEQEFKELATLDPRVRVSLQSENLGLYGNLRYLAQVAVEPYFAWLAADDILAQDFVEAFQATPNPKKLSVSNFVHQVCARDSNITWDSKTTIKGWWPETEPDGDWAYFSTEPSWIFGIWDTSYLKAIFPSQNYDFLDTVLLARVLFDNEIEVLNVARPSVIGLWPNRPPNHVNGKYHGFAMWAFAALRLLVQRKPLSIRTWKGYLTALFGRILFSTTSKVSYFRKKLSRT